MIARFCSQCGSALGHAPPTRCAACGAEHWRNAKPAACAVVLRGKEVLLARRAIAPWRDGWCAPGGFCDEGEHPVLTAERETLEEVGIPVRVTGALGIWLARYADEPADAAADEITVAYYLAEPVDNGSSARLDAETAEARWFALGALPTPLVPPAVLPAVLAAVGRAGGARATTPLLDRPPAG